MKIITRKQAIKKGKGRYFTGKPCKHGHIADRDVKTGTCRDCKLEYTRQYFSTKRLDDDFRKKRNTRERIRRAKLRGVRT